MKRRKVALALALPAALVATAVVAVGASAGSSAAPVGSGKPSPKKSVCGMGTGKKATGKPINIGAIVTVAVGVNWDEITDNARAYFNCVNDNGGLFGRKINYIVHVDPINPELVAAFAKKLIEEEHVVAIVGNIDVMDCAVNAQYYASKKFYVIGDGVHDLCYGGTPYHIPINMGPAYSTLGAAQYLVRKGVKGTIVSVAPTGVDAAGTWNKPAVAFAKAHGLKGIDVHDPYPAQASYALKYVQLAGDGGGVILDFTTDQVLTVLKAAEQQGIANKVLWAASTPAYDTRFAANAGKFWDGKIGINTELEPFTTKGPDAALYRAVHAKYTPKKWGLSTFGEFGFLDAQRSDRGHARAEAEPAHRQGREHRVHEDQELAQRLALQAVLQRQPAGAPPEQLGPDLDGEERARWCRQSPASRSPQSPPLSDRHARRSGSST